MADIVAFLSADGADSRGRRFDDVLALDDSALERFHDFIQWLFPLTEPSRAVPDAPVLDAASLERLRASTTAQARQRQAADRMLQFYTATDHWLTRFDHNHLRITRIIKSLRLIAGDEDAVRFRDAIMMLSQAAPIDARARQFWAQA
jgi:hypothetical protein